jgi:hypothetical protein
MWKQGDRPRDAIYEVIATYPDTNGLVGNKHGIRHEVQ